MHLGLLSILVPTYAEGIAFFVGKMGFELLEEIEKKDFLVVFVTAFKDYAIRAFNASNTIIYLPLTDHPKSSIAFLEAWIIVINKGKMMYAI